MSDALLPDQPDGYQTRATSPDGGLVWIVDTREALPTQSILGDALWRKNPPRELFAPSTQWSFEDRAWTGPRSLTIRGGFGRERYPASLWC